MARLYPHRRAVARVDNKRLALGLPAWESVALAVCSDLVSFMQPECFEPLIDALTTFLTITDQPMEHKLFILSAENGPLKPVYGANIHLLQESKLEEYLGIRRRYILGCIETAGESDDGAPVGLDRASLYELYNGYTSWYIRACIGQNRYFDILQFLYKELESYQAPSILTSLLRSLVLYNNLFLLESRESIAERLAQYSDMIGVDNSAQLQSWLDFSPEGIRAPR